MKKLIFTCLFLLSSFAHAHECSKFFSSGWAADQGYACTVVKSDLNRMKLHRMEICIGSVPYLDNRRYAHAEYKSIPLSQYNNPYSQADGINNKFFDVFYTGLAFVGENEDTAYIQNRNGLYLETYREGSNLTNELDYKAKINLNLETGRGNLSTYYRKPSLVFKKKWEPSIQVNFNCQRVNL